MTTLITHLFQSQKHQFLNNNANKPVIKHLAMLLFIIFCMGYSMNSQSYPSDLKGPFYTGDQSQYLDTFACNNQGSWHDASFTSSYNNWNFTNSSSSSFPRNYFSLSIQSIQTSYSNSYLKFNISQALVYQSYISFKLTFCSLFWNCFTSVTIRMLAIDYDQQIYGSPYEQVKNGIYIQYVTFSDYQSNKVIDVPIAKNISDFVYRQFLTGFSLAYNSNNYFYVVLNYGNFQSSYKFNTGLSYSCCTTLSSSSSFQFLFYSIDILTSKKRFKIYSQNWNFLSLNSRVTYTDNTIISSQPYQTFIFGLRYISIQPLRLNLQTTFSSNRNFKSESNIFNSSSIFTIGIFWTRISKILCPSSEPTYLTDTQTCNQTCQSDGYYIQNYVTCYPCKNPTCLKCISNTTQCTECDSDTRILSNVSQCNVKDGYYQNNFPIAGNCVEHCSKCQNNISCDKCEPDFYFKDSITCLQCSQIFSNCITCSDAKPAICSTCQDKYYFDSSLHNCTSCFDNCSVCSDSQSCTSCQISYFYYTNTPNNKCLFCVDIFPNCLECSLSNNSKSVQCTLCNYTYYKNSATYGCTACVDNCTECQDSDSCTTCLNDYLYTNPQKKCLACQDIFPNCLECKPTNNSKTVQCSACNYSFYKNTDYGCTTCVDNCTSCVDSWSCITCLTQDYIYNNDTQSCMLCKDLFLNCSNCTTLNISSKVQCSACDNQYAMNISIDANKYTTCFYSYCGDFIIVQPQEECDDGNSNDFDGCNSLCQIQPGFSCISYINENYADYNFSKCFISDLIQIKYKYLQKDPLQNKVTFRFNLQPKFPIFTTKNFLQKFSDTILVLWEGYTQGTLKVFKVQNGLQKNGLYSISFCYQKQWKNVEIYLNLANSNLSVFTTFVNISARLLLQTESRILQAVADQTPFFSMFLPQTADNNLVMYSENYGLYTFAEYCSLFLVFSVWVYWLAGLFYGKMVVIDFIVAIQLILLCSMTSGQLTPGLSGMMLQNFTFYTFTGLFSSHYQERSIYQNISSQLISANISDISFQNLSMWLAISTCLILMGIISNIFLRICNSKNLLFTLISKYIFGQFLLYSLLPFLLSGSISTIICLKKLIAGASTISMVDIATVVFFNMFVISMIVLITVKIQFFGQFKSHFIRFDICQYFYGFVVIYVTVIGFLFTLIFDTDLNKFSPTIVIVIFISILVFNIYKNPYLQSRHSLRIYLLYGTGILLTCLILIQNIIAIDTFKQYLSVILVAFQLILSLITGYYLFLSIKSDGKPKLDSFLEEYNQKIVQIQTNQQKGQNCIPDYQVPVSYRLNKSVIDYYQKQSKILQNIKKNTLPETINYDQEYQDLNRQNQNKQKKSQTQQIYSICSQENQKKAEKLIKSSKLLKMSLKCHLINEEYQSYESNRSLLKQQPQKHTLDYQKKKNMDFFINQSKQNHQKKQFCHQNQTANYTKNQNLQDFPEELVTDYKIHEFFAEREKQIKSQKKRLKIKHQQKFKEKIKPRKQSTAPMENLRQISYFQWSRQLQAQDQQLEKAKKANSKHNQS